MEKEAKSMDVSGNGTYKIKWVHRDAAGNIIEEGEEE